MWLDEDSQGHGMEPVILNTPSCISASKLDPIGQQWSDHRMVTNLLIWESLMVTCELGDLQSQWIKVKREDEECKEVNQEVSLDLDVCLFASSR